MLTLDVGLRMGVTCARRGAYPPKSWAVELRGRDESSIAGQGNLMGYLNRLMRDQRPVLVVKEAPLSLRALARKRSSQASSRVTYELHGVVQAVCARFGIFPLEVAPNVVRQHFIGTKSAGGRDATKKAVVAECIARGYLPEWCTDDCPASAPLGPNGMIE